MEANFISVETYQVVMGEQECCSFKTILTLSWKSNYKRVAMLWKYYVTVALAYINEFVSGKYLRSICAHVIDV